jgi:hypothetical protein
MTEHVPDFSLDPIQEAINRARQHDAIENLRSAMRTARVSLVIMPILLALILWRVW